MSHDDERRAFFDRLRETARQSPPREVGPDWHPADIWVQGYDGYWAKIESDKKPDYELSGKYLFFSTDPEELFEIARAEITDHNFHTAKINGVPSSGEGGEHVLCLYYSDGSRARELAARARGEHDGVKFRGWKSEAATRAGRYSEEFLAGLPAGERARFERDAS